MIGKTISHFQILKNIGKGNMGAVYKAQDLTLDRFVAIKFLSSEFTTDQEINARFKREARAAAVLNHPNIITIHEIGEYKRRQYIAMEFVDGESLKEMVSCKELSLDEVVEIASQICEGLLSAHGARIVHRDIKPANILLEKTGRVKIVDFGLAKLMDGTTKLTKDSSTLGTLSYMSPEQIRSSNVDQRSDIFSLGVVLYEMITGKLPFECKYEAAVFYSILNEEPEPLALYKAGISIKWQRLIDKSLSKDPNTRYQSVTDLLADLKKLARKPATTASFHLAKKIISKRHFIWAGFGLLIAMAIYIILSLANINLR